MAKKDRSLNYYFLKKHLHPKAPSGYRQDIVNVIVNRNETENRNKFLLIQEKNEIWGFPKQGIEDRNLSEGFFETLTRNLGEELGFRGMKVIELKPRFTQKAYIFNFEKQVYDDDRSEEEVKKGRPTKGKIYHLAIMSYKGPDEMPLDLDNPKITTLGYQWVTENEGRDLIYTNLDVWSKKTGGIDKTSKFHISFYERIINSYNLIQRIYTEKNPFQQTLL